MKMPVQCLSFPRFKQKHELYKIQNARGFVKQKEKAVAEHNTVDLIK